MKENEKKQNDKVVRIVAVGAALTGIGVFAGYHIGYKKAVKHSHKNWVDLAHRVTDSGETLGLMIPEENGFCTYLDLKPASEDYEGMIRRFLNIYSI